MTNLSVIIAITNIYVPLTNIRYQKFQMFEIVDMEEMEDTVNQSRPSFRRLITTL